MKHSDVISTIAKQTGKEPKNKDIANVLDLTQEAIRSRAFREKEYSYSEIEKLENFYKINFANQTFIDDIHDTGSDVIVDYYFETLGSCGNGAFEYSDVKEKIKIPKMCFSEYFPLARYSAINAYGNSMSPTIQNKDLLLVRSCEGEQVKDNQVYVFCYNDRLFVKRLVQDLDKITIISDNSDKDLYPTQTIEKEEMNSVRIIGRIVGLIRGKV
jgi:phage repressor protein C with HTH and peptisase S24 domain